MSCTSVVPFLLLCLMLGFQVVSSYTAQGACLQGFVTDIPEENTLMRYTRLSNNEDSTKTFLFPSMAFLCNGTLQEFAILYVVGGSDNIVWRTNLTANMSIWRPTATGYKEVVRFELVVHLPGANQEQLYVVIRNPHIDTVVVQPLKLVTVQKGDIIGVTLSPKTNAEYIPILLRSTGSGSGKQEGCGDIDTAHNCNVIRDKMPLIAVNVTMPQEDVPSNATGEGITPTATSSCACSHEVSEVTRLSTVYINVCSSINTPLSYGPRQPPILTTAINTESDSMTTPTGSSTVSTMLHQDTPASLSTDIGSIKPKQTTHSHNQLRPTLVPPLGNTIGDPHATGSEETTVTQSMKRAESACEGTLVTSAALGGTVIALLMVTITLSVLVALLAMKVKQLKLARNMQGFVKTCNAYIDIEQKEKNPESKDINPESKDTESC